MRKILLSVSIFLVIMMLYGNGFASFLHAPHNKQNGLDCISCHEFPFSAPYLGWVDSYNYVDDGNVDNTITNFVCLRCHAAGATAAPDKGMHSSRNLSTSKGKWTTQCIDCHNPHFQDQLNWIGDPALYLITGSILSKTYIQSPKDSTELKLINVVVNPNASEWADPNLWTAKTGREGRGLIFISDQADPKEALEIVDVIAFDAAAGSATIAVAGKMTGLMNTDFGIIYGQLVKSSITFSSAHSEVNIIDAPVKFFNPEGGFTDTNQITPVEGVCQVCHTVTNFWKNDGSAMFHAQGANCASCHSGKNGFKGGADHVREGYVTVSQSCAVSGCHDTAISDPIGNTHKSNCAHCHVNPSGGNFSLHGSAQGRRVPEDGPLNECITCHSALAHDSEGDHNNRIIDPTCSDCHTSDTTVLGNPGSGSLSSQADVDILHRSDCGTCHGYSGSKLDPTTVSNVISDGISGNQIICSTCHVIGHTCLTCHAKSQGSRIDIVAEFNKASNHAHTAGLDETSCYGCHWESSDVGNMTAYHSGTPNGAVDLVVRNGFRPIDYAINITAIQYKAGDPLDEINTHCLGCHDSGTEIWSDAHNRNLNRVDWDVDKHGSAAATFDLDGSVISLELLSPYVNNAIGQYSVACAECHRSHGSSISFLIRTNVNEVDITIPSGRGGWGPLCMTCHNTGAIFGIHHDVEAGCAIQCHYMAWVDGVVNTFYQECIACHYHGSNETHTPSGSDNLYNGGEPLF